jgi:hypothetical protein
VLAAASRRPDAGGESSRAPALDPDAPDATTIDGRPIAVTAIAGNATVVRRSPPGALMVRPH